MTDKSPEEKAAELAADVQASRQQNAREPGAAMKIAVVGGVCLASVAFLTYLYWPRHDEHGLKTSENTSFVSGTGDGFGNLARPVPPRAPDPNPELLKQIEEMKKLIAELKNRKPETVTDQAAIDRMNEQVAELQHQIKEASEGYEQTLSQKDLELQRLKNELDARRLQNGEDVDNDEARRLAAQQLLDRRIKSPLDPLGGSGGSGEGKQTPDSAELDQRRLSQNELFARASAKRSAVEQAKIVANPSNTVMQGTVVQASLETAINTDMPGAIRAIVTEDVHSVDGQRVLIPRGSKVLGRYSDNIKLGQKRVMVIWDRLILPDYQTVTINSYGADAIGQAGVSGKVDSHFLERFGSASLISVIGIAPAVATASLTNRNSNSDDKGGYNETTALANAISQNMQSSLGGVIGEYLNRPPTIGVHQGANVTIFVDRDLEIF
ncbi:TrbI/VirB10 family protein [Brucella sp. 22210]|uniref:TrbI/VirB10 family protein n=1 Tax=Brucella sp. 22210 TaxID=3453892 RepID=UPI003F87DDFF